MTQKTPSKTSPSLEVVSPAVERRRIPRIALTHEQFRHDETHKLFSVADLSPDGMALKLIDADDAIYFTLGSKFKGTLNFRRHKYPVAGTVRHLEKNLIGCQFENLAPEVVTELGRLLDPASLGKDLRPLPTQDGSIWYHAPTGTDLVIWRGWDGQFTKLLVIVMGNGVIWEDSNLRTGMVSGQHEPSEGTGVFRFDTLHLDLDPAIDPQKLQIAKTLLMSSNLPADTKRWFERRLEGGSA